MYPRNLLTCLQEAVSDTPVVLVNGARQTGKSTLVQSLAGTGFEARYLTLDDATALAAARTAPAEFIGGMDGPVILDEVQRAPELFVALKATIDRARRPGRFLLTGSADVLMLPAVSESLAGRMEVLTLWPLSQGELASVREGFIDGLFSRSLPPYAGTVIDRTDLVNRVLAGGFPEVLARGSVRRRRAWFGSYVTTILQRDIRDIANIEGLTDLPRLLALLATRAGSLLNYAELSRSSGIAQSTLKRYMTLLEMTFLVHTLPAWSGNLGKRLTKSPKLMLSDTGLAAYLLGLDDAAGVDMGTIFGSLLENFVSMEIRKQCAWSEVQPRLYHFRTQTDQEVDLVLEDARGRVAAIEVKASGSVSERDFRHLSYLAELLGKRFMHGVVLYTGNEAISFGTHLTALPVSALWELNATPTSSTAHSA
ncbi:ATP-binding protein [Longimicrobium sp.]|uniref:ATP-binding protein n=1 Tax=Longimicrobium sp. TaxID=2029185 RepID=UPI002C5ECA55|nr:ATP-binding protein [Longimicrobium sp.]HSU14259.1 ATP-binding protein [Longimicrobium sp.]